MMRIWEQVMYVIVDRCSPSRYYLRHGRKAIRLMNAVIEKGRTK